MLCLASCKEHPAPRPQLVVVVNTTAPVVGQLDSDTTLSADAAIDSVRVDIYAEGLEPVPPQEFVVPDALDWPLSFGVAGREGGPSQVTLRIRGFRAQRASRPEGATALSPPIGATIDRLVDLPMPTDSVRAVHIVLDGACFGHSVDFFAVPRKTCVDENRISEDPWVGVTTIPDDRLPPTLVGTWPGAREKACAAPASEGRLCIAGGFSLLGDPALIGWDLGLAPTVDPAPLRPVMMSPFWMDETEFTVGRFRELVQRGLVTEDLPALNEPNDPFDPFCTWLGQSDDANDQLPLNCVHYATAAEACTLEGGMLPSEAQWEHAARGRGRGRRYPWGNEQPDCCTASMGRYGTPEDRVCLGEGPEPVGSHPNAAPCGELGDESIDGVLDLAGSVAEFVRDTLAPYDDEDCWSDPGVLRNPVCIGDGGASRGASFADGPLTLPLALRSASADGGSQGFRCVYGDKT